MERDEAAFEKHAELVGKRVLESESALVVHHYDCDGIASAGVVSQAFVERAIPSRTLVAKRIDEQTLAEIAKAEEKTIVITDLASSSLQEIADALKEKTVFVIDHHPPAEFTAENISTVNPHNFGLDGAIELSAASTGYYCFKHLNSQRIAQLGIVGAVGDMQDQEGFIDLNRKMVTEAEENKFVFVNRDLRLFGRVSRPLVWFLAYCDEPFIPGLSGNEKACAIFLNNLGLQLKTNEQWTTYYDLNVFDRKKL
ncbi:MAG: DHH family phosphoesterase, partial [Candidatus Micrarchaeota archaeon]